MGKVANVCGSGLCVEFDQLGDRRRIVDKRSVFGPGVHTRSARRSSLGHTGISWPRGAHGCIEVVISVGD